MNAEIYIGQLLRRLGLTSNRVGFLYLSEAVILALKDLEYLHRITKLLYPEIAQTYGISSSCVERNIRSAIDRIWKADRPLLHKIMDGHMEKKPSNGCFIAILREYCIEQEQIVAIKNKKQLL